MKKQMPIIIAVVVIIAIVAVFTVIAIKNKNTSNVGRIETVQDMKNMMNTARRIIIMCLPYRVFSRVFQMLPMVSQKNLRRYSGLSV